jgi:protein TonB
MSSIAYASRASGFGHEGVASAGRRQARRRAAGAGRLERASPLSASGGDGIVALGEFRPRTPAYVWWLLGAAIVLHGLGAWYVATRPPKDTLRAPKHEVSVALERPKPPPPKVEPPKPQQRQPQRPTQVLPPIETAAPVASEPDAVSAIPAEPAPPPAAPAPPAPVAEIPVTAPFGRAGYLNNPPPAYPAIAMRQGWQGTVVLRVRVLASGRPASVEVQKSSGRKVLDDAAVQTVQAWSFAPAKRGDTPIDGWATVPIEFKVE